MGALGRLMLGVGVVGVLTYAAQHTGGLAHAASQDGRDAHSWAQAATAVGAAKSKIGDWYLWGGNGPDEFDCSGLVKFAWAQAGVDLPRISQDQYADGDKVPADDVHAGDLVFFAGAPEPGAPAGPGHVAIVLSAKHHTMVEAYGTGYRIRIAVYGRPDSPPGDADPLGFTDPTGGA